MNADMKRDEAVVRIRSFLEAWASKPDEADGIIYGLGLAPGERPRELLAADLTLLVGEPYLCDGCNVRGFWEHRCHGTDGAWRGDPPCECPEPICRERHR